MLECVLRDWPSENLTVMAFLDRDGIRSWRSWTATACSDLTSTPVARPAPMFTPTLQKSRHWRARHRRYHSRQRHIPQPGPDQLLHCPLRHRRRLPRALLYWPEWNPIELAWNWLKDGPVGQMRAPKRNPVPVVRRALGTIGAPLARAFIRHADVYPARWST